MRAEIPFGQREFFLKSFRPSFLIKRAALGNLKASFHCTHWHRFFPLNKAFSKTYPSVLTLKEGCSKIIPSFFVDKASCTRQFESELSLHSLASLFPIKEGSTFLTKPLSCPKREDVTALQCWLFYLSVSPARRAPHPNQAFPSRKGKDVTALRCSEPLRSKVGGASKPCAMVVRDGTAGRQLADGTACGRKFIIYNW